MKRLSVAVCMTLLTLAAAASAKAADDFTGFYVGGNAGYSFGMSAAHTTTIFSPTGYFATTSVPAIATSAFQNITANGFNAGGQGGYNLQGGHIVLGIEADYGAMRVNNGASSTATYPCCSPTAFTVNQNVSTTWLVTIRPRVGVVVHHVMVYVTGGLAITSLTYSELFTDTFATAHESAGAVGTRVGWTGGGGVEFRVSKHISIKGEYLSADIGAVSAISTNLTAFAGPIAFPSNIFFHTADIRAQIVRGGINFRF